MIKSYGGEIEDRLQAKDIDGCTPLLVAAQRGCTKAAVMLLTAAAQVMSAALLAKSRDAALLTAVKHGRKGTLRALLHSGANANVMGPLR